MNKIYLLVISIFLVSCGGSPEKLLDKGDKYLENAEIEKATDIYQKIVENYPDDTLAHKAQYNIAWIELDKNRNYDLGYDVLNHISTEYVDTEIGKAAQNDLDNFPEWLLNKTNQLRSDSTVTDAFEVLDYFIDNFQDNALIPEAMYLKGNIFLNDSKDFYRAINTYQEIVHKYKGSSFEPMSKFMIGYIYANVQSDQKKAEITYSEFLQEFPEHELAPSVQFELEYLGKQIKDIEDLKKRTN